MSFLSRVLDGMGDAFRRRAGSLLEPLVDALTSGVSEAAEIVGTEADPYPAVFNLDLTPYPDAVGAATGTPVPGGLTVEEQRTYVRDRGRQKRGRPATLKAAAAATLAGSQRVNLLERTPDPDRVTVQVYSSEVVDLNKTRDAALSQKPVGLLLTVEVLPGATYQHMTDFHGPTYADNASAFSTYALARDHVPE